jgi:hypothetical protein
VAYCDPTLNSGPAGDDSQPAQLNEDGNIQIEYHPREPQFPFHTREDLKFAEITLEAGMTRKQSNVLIQFFHRCIRGEGKFTISNHGDTTNKFKAAANWLTKVR